MTPIIDTQSDEFTAAIRERRRQVQAFSGGPKPRQKRFTIPNLLNCLGQLLSVLPLAVLAMALLNLSDGPGVRHGEGEQWLGTIFMLPFAWAIGGALAITGNPDKAAKDPGEFALGLYVLAPMKFALWLVPMALLAFIMFGFSQGFAHFGHGGGY